MPKNFVSVNSLSITDKDKLRNAVREMNDSMLRVNSEKELQKDILNKISEELGVEKKLVRRLAKTYYKSSFEDEVEENNAFEEFFSTVVLGKKETP